MKNNQTSTLKEPNINSVSLVEFTEATAKWRYVSDENNGMIDDVILPNFFNIPMIDLIELVEELKQHGTEKAVSVNAYIGIKKYDVQNNTYEMKLFLTGINSEGNKILQHDGESAIYDFILPCPPTC